MKLNSLPAILEAASLDSLLNEQMKLYSALSNDVKKTVQNFVLNFWDEKQFLCHPKFDGYQELMAVVAGNAALVGAAQETNYFNTVKWIYLCADDLADDGDALGFTTVRLRADVCVNESKNIETGHNLVVHEFAHVLDSMLGISGSTTALRNGFEKYRMDLMRGREIPIADTGEVIVSQVEFFARATECFYTDAANLKLYNKALFQELVSIYGLDLSGLNWSALQNKAS